MKTDKKLPTVVIVGRTNVGKSTFFNRLAADARSITYDMPGVTRDVITDIVTWHQHTFRLIDTGGIGTSKSRESIEQETRQRAINELYNADVILLMIDSSVGLLPEDREIARMLRHKEKKVFVVMNKTDRVVSREYMHEGFSLGFPVYGVSASHGHGIDELMRMVTESIELVSREDIESVAYRVAIIGKPNVGKSSLLNQLLKKERTIVADLPGTTREAVSDIVTFYQEDIRITDTPGIRRKRGVTLPLEQLMVKSALHAIDASHIVLLVVDGSAGSLSDQEIKLAFYAFEERHKALIILYNKQDIMTDEHCTLLDQQESLYERLIDRAITMSISCKTGRNIGKIIPLIHTVWARMRQQIPDHELTMFFNEQLTRRPLFKNGQQLAFYRAHQIRVAPITIQLTVGHPPYWQQTQLGFLDNQLRSKYNLKGVPVVFTLRKAS